MNEMYKNLIISDFKKSIFILKKFLKIERNILKIEHSAKMLSDAFKNGNKVLSCGNGGSHCDAMHFSEELTGCCYEKNRGGYPAIVISDPSHISCVSNDFGYEYIFSRYIEALGKQGDILFAISTSGNSKNIINAINSAHFKEMKTILLTGNDGGKASKITDIEIKVPHFGYSDRIQEIHIKIIHILVKLIEQMIEK